MRRSTAHTVLGQWERPFEWAKERLSSFALQDRAAWCASDGDCATGEREEVEEICFFGSAGLSS